MSRHSIEYHSPNMFAEELGGNASKRRQEEARDRRRKLKQQQEQKRKAEERANAQQVLAAERAAAGGSVTVPVTSPSPAASKLELPAASNGAKNTAVQKALEQRHQRQVVQHQLKATVTIQSFYRMHRSNASLLNQQSTLLGQRLQDLKTLTNLLKQQTQKNSYISPPATSTALVSQLILLTRSLPYSGTEKTIRLRFDSSQQMQNLLELALLPGLLSHDENSNPFIVWSQSTAGQQKIEYLIRLAWVVATAPDVDDAIIKACLAFVAAMAGGSTVDGVAPPLTVSKFGKQLLWLSTKPSGADLSWNKRTTSEVPASKIGSSLDLIVLLRHHLLYKTGSPDPIPKAADRLRDACISARPKRQADQVLRVVLQGIMGERSLQVRFVCEILTIPLLSWKTIEGLSYLSQPEIGSRTPRLMAYLESFISYNAEHINEGRISEVLCSEVPLTICPATPTQILLANLVHIGRQSSSLNGSHPSKFDFESAASFYKILATLVDALPLATFSSRESVVEWISDGKGHHTPIVLSSIVMEQCKSLLVDSYVRRLLDCAIDEDALRMEVILQQKNDKDIRQEKALQDAGRNAASLAAQEAKVDRSKGFFNSAGWARRIKGGMTKLLSKDDPTSQEKGSSLIDGSAVSRKLAQGKASAPSLVPEKFVRIEYSSDLFKTLCLLYGIILARWGGDGGRDCIRNSGPLIRHDLNGAKQEVASASANQCTQALLNNFIFSTTMIQACWALIQSDPAIVGDVYKILDPHKERAPIRSLSILPRYQTSKRDSKNSSSNNGAAMLFCFVCALSRVLIVTDDSEIHEMGKPLPLHQLRRCIQTLKQLLHRACCLDDVDTQDNDEATREKHTSNYFGLGLISASARTMRDLYDRSSRRPLSVPKLWLIDDLMEKEIRRCKSKEEYVRLLSTPVLRVCPFLVSFKRRLKLFERIVATDRVEVQGENSQNPFHSNPLKPGIGIRITRGRILEDGLATMNHLGRNMRQRLAVQYYNEAGMRESGVDVGGLFKEFWTDLCAIAFDPNYALFRVTEGKWHR